MTAHARPLPVPAATSGQANRAAPAGLCAVGALTLLTWPVLDAAVLDAAVTARGGGVSSGPYATLNLSLSVGDEPARVLENRRRLAAALGAAPGDFVFARQVHGAAVRIVGEADRGSGAVRMDDAIADADALVTTSPGVVLAILTADCVPIVLHDPVAGVLACVHAGWRGTVAGVGAAAVAAMTSLGSRPSDVIAGLGPASAPARYRSAPTSTTPSPRPSAPPRRASSTRTPRPRPPKPCPPGPRTSRPRTAGSSTCGPPTATSSARPASPTTRFTSPPSPPAPYPLPYSPPRPSPQTPPATESPQTSLALKPPPGSLPETPPGVKPSPALEP